jgi:mono/diheme cytochrome c family protein
LREVTENPDGYIYFTTSQYDPPEGTPRPEYDYILRLVPQSARPTGLPLASEWKGPRAEDLKFDPATMDPKALVGMYCASCHGPGLRGGMQRGLLYGNWQVAKDDAARRDLIERGLADKGMPAFGNTLNRDQVAALIRFINENQTTEPEPERAYSPSPRGPGEFE